jgi:hypothetical protein
VLRYLTGMPTPASAVPWSDVETMVKAGIGVRETARRLGLDEERIKRQVSRKGWLPMSPAVKLQQAEQALSVVREELCPQVPTAADMLAKENADNSRRGRAALLRGGAEAAEDWAALDSSERLERAPQAASLTKVLATAGDWASSQRGNVRINILAADPFSQVQIEGDK